MNAPQRELDAFAPTRPTPTKLAHIVLRTPRLAAMRAFYLALLNAQPTFENDQVCFMTYDDEHHRIGLVGRPQLGSADADNAGLEHIAFTYADLPSLLAAYSHNKAQGVEPFWAINHGPTISLYYRDPDGNKIELQHDVFPDAASLSAFFASGAYEENFIGVIFDPDEMIRDWQSGKPIDDLTRRPPLPPGVDPWSMVRD